MIDLYFLLPCSLARSSPSHFHYCKIFSGFKSRSFQSFQEALERGEAAHMMPVENAKERLRKKEIKLEDIPYMQRGGSWVSAIHDF